MSHGNRNRRGKYHILLHIKVSLPRRHRRSRRFTPSEPLLYARAIYDFMARNSQELTITKGDAVQVRPDDALQRTSGNKPVRSVSLPPMTAFVLGISQVVKRSNNWWLIRNNRGEEGSVPRNVVELTRSSSPLEDQQVSRATLCSSAE